ncbi:hypothetical protein CDL12_08223 [Handroanthus impetiginosus]|uniref:Uncharacterized protein n=1 Tax=Handroanthus impetiginosus TaxID=429701 RepID=A0A2G9HNL8_9LAMI|nr:hypothetical protein CDL12_08223 [Handroanthus impetiginosus]
MSSDRLIRMSKPLSHSHCDQVSRITSVASKPRTLTMCLNRARFSSENPATAGGDRKPVVEVNATGCKSAFVPVSEPKTDKDMDLGLLLGYVGDVMSRWKKFITKERPWRWHIQMFVEKVIIDCRFFTLLAVAGSLLSSVLCFVEGCVLILETYFQYFNPLQKMPEQGQVVPRLIEAIDMFLVGTAMLIFGVALHVMFVGQNNLKGKGSQNSVSTLSRNFNLQKLKSWMGMESAMEAKSKIGHAVIMILQVQLLEKFKSIPVTNGMDLACFAGAVFLSSACIFVLSRIYGSRAETTT